jgi:hypothetical protein
MPISYYSRLAESLIIPYKDEATGSGPVSPILIFTMTYDPDESLEGRFCGGVRGKDALQPDAVSHV